MIITPTGRLAELIAATNRPDLMAGFELDDDFYAVHAADIDANHPEMAEEERRALTLYAAALHPNAPHNQAGTAVPEKSGSEAAWLMNAQLRDTAQTRDIMIATGKEITDAIIASQERIDHVAGARDAMLRGSVNDVCSQLVTMHAYRKQADQLAIAREEISDIQRDMRESVEARAEAERRELAEARDAKRERFMNVVHYIQIAVMLAILLTLLATRAHAQNTVQGAGQAGTPKGGILTVQGAAGSTPVPMSGSAETGTIYNGATALTPKFAVITASSSGVTTLVAAVTSKRIRVISIVLIANAAVNVKFQSHVTPTDITGLLPLGANGGFAAAFAPTGYFQTVAGEALDINLSGAVAVGGWLTYVEI